MDLNESWQRWVRARAAAQRFGARDRLGTARLIDAAAKQRAAACVQSGRTPSQPLAAIHLLIWGIGLLLVDNCSLSMAADALHEARRATGALVVAALAVPGGTGCTVNPLLLL